MRPVYRLDTSVWLPRPRHEVFGFFADARNLERITPPFIAFRIIGAPPEMRAGARIEYCIGLRGVRMKWHSEISVWDPPLRFIDVQLRGPYASWEHTHLFDERDGGTLVTDAVRYALRGPSFAARLINSAIIAPDLRRIFDYRHNALQDAFNARGAARATAVTITAAEPRAQR
jgi:ligand-binding SRPBCC domain-containing protein